MTKKYLAVMCPFVSSFPSPLALLRSRLRSKWRRTGTSQSPESLACSRLSHSVRTFSISQTRLSRSLEWLVVSLTICCRVHIFDTFSCGNKALLKLPRGQDRPVLPDRVANRIRSNFLPRGASRTIYYNYRIIKVACVQSTDPRPPSQ